MVTPDSFIVDKNTFVVLERDIFTKSLAIRPHPEGGGTVEEQVPRERQGIASLTDDQACEVARLAARVEEHYGSPQDIEWGLASGELFLLQSRPITTLG
jgi:pyruvate,water dikinase